MNVHKLDVVAKHGVPFRVVVLADGNSENFDCSSYNGKSSVEFYDRRYDYTPDGQFTGHRLDLETALESDRHTMSWTEDAWFMDRATSQLVNNWLRSLIDRESVRV